MGRRSSKQKDTKMAQIGSFTRGENGIYTGEIRTLTLRVKATIRPVERENDKAPRPPRPHRRRGIRGRLDQGGA